MFNFLLIVQCALSLLIIFAVILQKTGRQNLGGLKTDPMAIPESGNKFLIKVTWALLACFFVNSITLANVSCKRDQIVNNAPLEKNKNTQGQK